MNSVPSARLDERHPGLWAFALAFLLLSVPAAFAAGCGDVITADTTLASDILGCSGNGLVIGSDNITLDCAGHSISGSGNFFTTGVYLSSRSGVTVKNCAVSNFNNGIVITSNSKSDSIINNTVNGNKLNGIYVVSGPSGNIISGNSLSNNYGGISIYYSNGNTVSSNTVTDNKNNGIAVYFRSAGNTLSGNTVLRNTNAGVFLDPYVTNNTLTANFLCTNVAYDILAQNSSNSGQGNTCDKPDSWNDLGVSGCSYACPAPPVTTKTLIDADGDGLPNAFTLSATDPDGVAQTFYSMDGGAFIAYAGGQVAIPPGRHTIRYYSVDTTGMTEAVHSQVDTGDQCPAAAGPVQLQGCPCGVSVLVTANNGSGQQPLQGAGVSVFDWTDKSGCAAENRPKDSEFSCVPANNCTTDASGQCQPMGVLCGRLYDVGVSSPQAQGKGNAWRSLGNLTNGTADARISFQPEKQAGLSGELLSPLAVLGMTTGVLLLFERVRDGKK